MEMMFHTRSIHHSHAGSASAVPAASIVSRIVSAPNFFLIVGVASLAIYAFQYFRGR